MEKIKLTKAEIQSNLTRQRFAELLILNLPDTHDGRNTWLLNYGIKKEARELRRSKGLTLDHKTQAAKKGMQRDLEDVASHLDAQIKKLKRLAKKI